MAYPPATYRAGRYCYQRRHKIASRANVAGQALTEVAVVFRGSNKTLASDLPIANLRSAGNPALGIILLPVMVCNPIQIQIQVIVGAVIARPYERTPAVRTTGDAAADIA